MLYLKDADLNDIEQIIQDDLNGSNPIRQGDKDETFAFTGKHVHSVLRKSALEGYSVKAVLDEQGFVLCLWGFVFDSEDNCYGWLIGTDRGQARARDVHRFHREELQSFPYTITAYTIHLHLDRWHKALGFKLVEELKAGNFPIKKYVRSPWVH